MRPRVTHLALLVFGAIAGCGAPHRAGSHGPDGTVVETTDSTFIQDVIEPGRPTVVYYWANGCVPCLFFGPKVEDLAARFPGRATFWKMNLGWSAERVRRYGIRAVPALAFYVGNREMGKMIGVPGGKTADSLVAFVEAELNRVDDSQGQTGRAPSDAYPRESVARIGAPGTSPLEVARLIASSGQTPGLYSRRRWLRSPPGTRSCPRTRARRRGRRNRR